MEALKTFRTTTSQSKKEPERWAPGLVVSSLLLILSATLYPYNFRLIAAEPDDPFTVIMRFVQGPSHLPDALRNVALFVPFGFGLACALQRLPIRRSGAIGLAMGAGAILSLSIEALQAFLPSRFPALVDVLTNSVGVAGGFYCFGRWGKPLLTQLSGWAAAFGSRLSVKLVVAVLGGYVVVLFISAIPLQRMTSLSNWDAAFPLLFGNERTGNRPWHGHITEVAMADRAISAEEAARAFAEPDVFAASDGNLLVQYQFRDGSYRDQLGKALDLAWRGDGPHVQDERGVFIAPGRWLESDAAAVELVQQMRESSQFTLIAIVATADPQQSGVARIISMSSDSRHRNFTLAQGDSNLIFRLRTPLTGKNGLHPDLVVPNVFVDTKPRHIIVTYDGSRLLVYIDGQRRYQSLELTPGVALFGKFVPLDIGTAHIATLVYYGAIFVPLGALLALLLAVARPLTLWGSLAAFGIVGPALVLELMLASISGRNTSLEYLVVSVAITAMTVTLLKPGVTTWLHSAQTCSNIM